MSIAQPLYSDPNRFIDYYVSQTGHGIIEGFSGAAVQYGRGFGSIFSRIFKFVAPLLRRGFQLSKPHLKNAAKNIATDAFNAAISKVTTQRDQNHVTLWWW